MVQEHEVDALLIKLLKDSGWWGLYHLGVVDATAKGQST